MDKAQPASLARCLDCDYLLHGLHEARCPECGRGFDLGDPATHHIGRPMPLWVRSWLKPVGWPTLVIAGAAWLGLSRFVADPEFNYMCIGPALLVLAWPALAAVIGIRAAFRRGLLAHYQRRLVDFGSERRRMWWIVGAFAVLHASTIVALPTRLWFLPFWWHFEAAATEMRAITPQAAYEGTVPFPSQMRWIGVWHVRVEGVMGEPGVIAFYTDGVGRLAGGGTGFVHAHGRKGMIGYNYGEDGWIIGDWYYFTTD